MLVDHVAEALLAVRFPLTLEMRADGLGARQQSGCAGLVLAAPLEAGRDDPVQRLDVLFEEGAAERLEELLALGEGLA